jgi:periplasmic divalent cation tolerance protein
MSQHLQVSTATPTADDAATLARSAVERRLAASAQIVGPIQAVAWHAGAVHAGDEWIVLLKTTADRYPQLEAHLADAHPWDNPEISATPILRGSEGCLSWLERSVSGPA